MRWKSIGAVAAAGALVAGCSSAGTSSMKPGTPVERRGDEIVVAGRMYHTGAPVVLWMDPGGYDAYRVEKRFVPLGRAPWDAADADRPGEPARFGLRRAGLSDAELERVRGGGWDAQTLGRVVDQFVIHYDVCGTSRQCFRVLHDIRGLSVHFMLDLDGTIYQTLDVKERAWHATVANDRSVGIEIANIGAYPANPDDSLPETLANWYGPGPDGRVRVTLPASMGDGGVRTPGFIAHPAREAPVVGEVHGRRLVQYDLTDQQYESLAHLTAALCEALPNIECDYPRDAGGGLLRRAMSAEELAGYRGVLGHWHVQENKVDPGPAFDWDRVIGAARRLSR